jgi:hypothetical protein
MPCHNGTVSCLQTGQPALEGGINQRQGAIDMTKTAYFKLCMTMNADYLRASIDMNNGHLSPMRIAIQRIALRKKGN